MPTLKDSNGTSYKDLSGESDTDDTTSNSDPLLTVSTESLQSTNPLNRKQLLFLFKCETTGRSHYDDRIIEIASVVIVPDNLTITQTEFSSLCHTLHCICSDGKLFPITVIPINSVQLIFSMHKTWDHRKNAS